MKPGALYVFVLGYSRQMGHETIDKAHQVLLYRQGLSSWRL